VTGAHRGITEEVGLNAKAVAYSFSQTVGKIFRMNFVPPLCLEFPGF
jgi:hypothetical protein